MRYLESFMEMDTIDSLLYIRIVCPLINWGMLKLGNKVKLFSSIILFIRWFVNEFFTFLYRF